MAFQNEMLPNGFSLMDTLIVPFVSEGIALFLMAVWVHKLTLDRCKIKQ